MLFYLLLGMVLIALGFAWSMQAGRPRRPGGDAGSGDGNAGAGWVDSGSNCGDAGGDGGGDGGGGDGGGGCD